MIRSFQRLMIGDTFQFEAGGDQPTMIVWEKTGSDTYADLGNPELPAFEISDDRQPVYVTSDLESFPSLRQERPSHGVLSNPAIRVEEETVEITVFERGHAVSKWVAHVSPGGEDRYRHVAEDVLADEDGVTVTVDGTSAIEHYRKRHDGRIERIPPFAPATWAHHGRVRAEAERRHPDSGFYRRKSRPVQDNPADSVTEIHGGSMNEVSVLARRRGWSRLHAMGFLDGKRDAVLGFRPDVSGAEPGEYADGYRHGFHGVARRDPRYDDNPKRGVCGSGFVARVPTTNHKPPTTNHSRRRRSP